MKIRLILLALLLFTVMAPAAFAANVEGRLVQSLSLAGPPLDVAISPDGRQLFVLEAGKLSLYSIRGELLGEYALTSKVSRIEAQSPTLVLLYGPESNQVDYLVLEVLHEVNTSGAPAKGPADAPVTIALFDDFQCPYCARLVPTLKQVEQLYPEQVRIVFKHYPLTMHNFARPAALAALAAERQGKFWEFHDQLFANYNQLNAAKLDEIAANLQLDPVQFKKDLADPALSARIDQDMREAEQLGVRGTPAVYVNGRQLQDRSINGFRGAIEQQLQLLRQE